MSTRCVVTFKDERGEYSVYKPCDGYPDGVFCAIAKAKNLAWPLPRFEADEFGASFVAANKSDAGEIRLTSGADAHGDLSYHYIVTCKNGELAIETIKL